MGDIKNWGSAISRSLIMFNKKDEFFMFLKPKEENAEGKGKGMYAF